MDIGSNPVVPNWGSPATPNGGNPVVLKKRYGCLRTFLFALLGVFAIGVIIAIAVAIDSDKTATTGDASTSNLEQSTLTIPPKNSSQHQIGGTAALGDWEITVSSYEIVDKVNADYGTLYYQPEEGSKYLLVHLTTTNTGDNISNFLPYYGIGGNTLTKLR